MLVHLSVPSGERACCRTGRVAFDCWLRPAPQRRPDAIQSNTNFLRYPSLVLENGAFAARTVVLLMCCQDCLLVLYWS